MATPSPAVRSQEISRNSDPLPTLAQTRSRLGYLGRFVRPHKRLFIASIGSSIAFTVMSLLPPFLFKYAIDDGIDKGHTGVVVLMVGLAVAAAVLAALSEAAMGLTSVFAFRVLRDLRVSLFRHVQAQGLDFFHAMRTGTVISRLTNDIDALENLVGDGIYMLFSNVLLLFGIEVFLFVMDWRLALATNVIFPLMLAATIAFRYFSARAYRRTRERMALVTAFLAESLSGMRVVQAFAAEDRMANEFDATNEHYKRANMETIYQSALYFPGVEWLAVIGSGIVLWYGGLLSSQDAIKAGVLFAFILFLNDFFDPIQQLSQFYSSFLSAMAALDKIMAVMETTPTIVDTPDARRLETLRGDVAFEQVSFSYSEGAPEVLRDINVAVTAGETIALVGHTGAGKSTFVKLLSRFYDPSAGSIKLDGVDLRELEARWLRRSLGIVPQEGFLFSDTIAVNIGYGKPGASEAEIVAAAQAVGADEFICQLEHGYQTNVGERGSHLSAGQRQLVAFARAMLADPALLVLDEATSSVDVATELRLSEGLRTLVAGRTAFIVAHRLSTIRGADRIFVIDDGMLVEEGTHDELVDQGGFYAGLYGSWNAEASIEECLDPSTVS